MTDQPPDLPARSVNDFTGGGLGPHPLSELAGAAYSSFIDAQLAEERNSKISLESRGITVITTSGSVVGVLFGLLAVIGGTTEFVLPEDARPWFAAALLTLTVSAIGGLLVNLPLAYEEADPKALEDLLINPDGSWAPEWEESIIEGSRRVAQVNIRLLSAARNTNRVKSFLLISAQIAEVVGVALLAMAVRSTI